MHNRKKNTSLKVILLLKQRKEVRMSVIDVARKE